MADITNNAAPRIQRFDVITALLCSPRPVTERALYQNLSAAPGDRQVIAAAIAALVDHGYADRRPRDNGIPEYSISQAGHDVLNEHP